MWSSCIKLMPFTSNHIVFFLTLHLFFAAALMQWQLDHHLQTVAEGANTPESLSRSPTLQLRGECRPLVAADRTARKREAGTKSQAQKLHTDFLLSHEFKNFLKFAHLED